MNKGAYFLKLREFIIANSNIEYLHILRDPKMFRGALQSTMLLVLRKGENEGDYVFRKNGVLIFSENTKFLEKEFKNKKTLSELNYRVRTGRLVWNQHKNSLTNNKDEGIPLIWAHNITEEGLKFPITSESKPQYVKKRDYDIGPAIVVNRITGTVKETKLRAAAIPANMKFIAENHVNVIFPNLKSQSRLNFGNNPSAGKIPLEALAKQISSREKFEVIRNITGNTQISKNELEKLFPISLN